MEANNKKSIALMAMYLLLYSCDLPDQVGPDDNYCTSGASVLSLDDSNVSSEVKNRIYNPAPQTWVIHTQHPDYNRNGRLVLIPTAFPNLPANEFVTREIIETAFFRSGTGSVRDYFYENSWGQFSLTNAGISDWITLANDREFYGQGGDWTRNSNMYRDACQASTIDWASVDLNGDRIITPNEALVGFIIPAGNLGANRPGSVNITYNGQPYTINSSFTFMDCKRLDEPERDIRMISYNYPLIWHELGHGFFGLPDRYQDFSGTGRGGQFDIMSDNFRNIHMTIYDKMKIGWVKPRILLPANQRIPEGRRCYRIQASAQTEAALILYSNRSPDEYLIVENINTEASERGFTSGYNESGLAIWWADMNSGDTRLIERKLISGGITALPLDHVSPRGIEVLLQYIDGTDPESITFIRNQNGQLNFGFRAVSPPGTSMFVEF
ncbi:hypothetical protein ACFSKL_14275 [Belliella marina]|uniref:M6 family metalloprotease domain-containing protein n=1 Tax=Belliella marina TaxID=1644146 RepID=A0ABW4VRV3_9BACT